MVRTGLAWLVVLGAFAADWAAMADQWWNSSTYNHVLFVPVILGWLVWLRRRQLLLIEPSAWWPGLVLFAGAALLWMLGAFASVATARQAGVVAMMIAAAIGLLGPRVSRGLVFPLAYMLFLVPFGDEFVPLLQMITAKITIALVHLSGIEARIDGVFIDTPAGLFEVAEACSGVKFLVAMIAFGALVANVCFLHWRRRAIFLAVCVVLPVLANGVRAWGTIFAAQYVGAEVAAGIDHLIYGWLFFAAVLLVLLAGSWRFFDRAPDDEMIDAAVITASPLLGRLARLEVRPMVALGCIALTAICAQGWAKAADALVAPLPPRIALPPVSGWERADYQPTVGWEPRAAGADHRLLGSYRDADGRKVDVFLALYAAQGDGREAGGFGEGALPPESAWSWLGPIPASEGGQGERLLADGQVERIALTWYRTGDLLTGANARLRLANLGDRLLLRARPTILLILSAEEGQGVPAAVLLDQFRQSAGPLDNWMDRVAGLR